MRQVRQMPASNIGDPVMTFSADSEALLGEIQIPLHRGGRCPGSSSPRPRMGSSVGHRRREPSGVVYDTVQTVDAHDGSDESRRGPGGCAVSTGVSVASRSAAAVVRRTSSPTPTARPYQAQAMAASAAVDGLGAEKLHPGVKSLDQALVHEAVATGRNECRRPIVLLLPVRTSDRLLSTSPCCSRSRLGAVPRAAGTRGSSSSRRPRSASRKSW